MPRSFQVNYARLTANPQTAFDLTTGEGAINAAYTVGFTDGTTLVDYPGLALSGTIRILLGPTDTPAAKLQQMIAAIIQQEGLDLTQGDRFFGVDGTQLAP